MCTHTPIVRDPHTGEVANFHLDAAEVEKLLLWATRCSSYTWLRTLATCLREAGTLEACGGALELPSAPQGGTGEGWVPSLRLQAPDGACVSVGVHLRSGAALLRADSSLVGAAELRPVEKKLNQALARGGQPQVGVSVGFSLGFRVQFRA